MTYHPDSECHDAVLHVEIELLGELMAAAARATEHLSDEELDAALDVQATSAHPPPKRVGRPRAARATS